MKDFYQDFGHNFIKLFNNKEVPSFVKEGEMLEQEVIETLPSSSFACVDSRSLPINDAANTFVSAAYYYGANEKNASVEERILKAAQLFEISEDVQKVAQELSNKKEAAVSTSEAWEISLETSKGIKTFSGNNSESLKKFAQFYTEELFNKLSFGEKIDCAEKIAGQMTERNLEVPERVLQVSGKFLPNVEKLAEQIKARAVRIFDHEKKSELCKMADELLDCKDKTLDGMHKIAEILDTIDQQNQLNRFYNKSILDPFASVFNTHPEEASKLATVISIGEKDYSFEELTEISTDILKTAFSSEVCEKLGLSDNSYNPTKLAELSTEERDLLASYL